MKDRKKNAKDVTVGKAFHTQTFPTPMLLLDCKVCDQCVVCGIEWSNKWQRLTEAKSWKAMLILLIYIVHKV